MRAQFWYCIYTKLKNKSTHKYLKSLTNIHGQNYQNLNRIPKNDAILVQKHKTKEYANKIIKAVRAEAERVSTNRFTIPVRIFA